LVPGRAGGGSGEGGERAGPLFKDGRERRAAGRRIQGIDQGARRPKAAWEMRGVRERVAVGRSFALDGVRVPLEVRHAPLI
jgi:hypothetical protein